MIGRLTAASLLGLALIGSAFADDPKKHDPHKHAPAGHSPLDGFKALAGDWVGKMSSGGQEFDAEVNYKVTSNGSAVIETIGPGSPHEMVTIIHQDGDALALTHYCGIGNQPRMKTASKPGPHKFEFKFTGASNLKSDKDMHMHDVTFEIVDKDNLKTYWSNYNNGKPDSKADFVLKRKK